MDFTEVVLLSSVILKRRKFKGYGFKNWSTSGNGNVIIAKKVGKFRCGILKVGKKGLLSRLRQ
jgi:hypothetical protein